MTPEEQKAATRRMIIGVWDQGNFRLIQELADPDRFTFQYAGQETMYGESYQDHVSNVRAAFPDLRNTIESQVAEGDMVVTRGTTRGTHRGPIAGIAPTGNSIEVPWVIFTTFQGGRIVAQWELYDGLGLMTQLGAIAAPAKVR